MAQFPIVGIGWSAGGLEPMQKLLQAMPAGSGMAFVVAAHLDPTRESLLVPLLARCTKMPVAEIRDSVRLEPDHVYVMAPDQELGMRDGVVHASRPTAPRHQRHPIDIFFRSLAEDQGERAIAVVLSGTGSNGSLALRFLKAEGGIVVVQDPETAAFDGMPRAAIATGVADLILPPEQMPERILELGRHPYLRSADAVEAATPEDQLRTLLAIVRAQTRHEFGCYKKPMLLRRIHRRMGLHGLLSLTDYIERLRNDAREVRALTADFTINVTGFFRDPEAWTELRSRVFMPLVEQRARDGTIRVWVPGCATGEEAYSIAMLIAEVAEEAGTNPELKIFATDVAEQALAVARIGRYPLSILDVVSEERLHRFFDIEDDAYIVNKFIRDKIVFAPQNLLHDAPFMQLDLVVCRNLLIYLDPEYQKRVIGLFHLALREAGCLFLGPSEAVSGQEDLFEPVSRKWRIYTRIGPTRHDVVDFPLVPLGEHGHKGVELPAEAEPRRRAREVMAEALLDRFAPPSVLVDSTFRVHYLRGNTDPYLQPPRGEPTYQLLAMAREGLQGPLHAALRRALEHGEEAAADGHVRRGDLRHPVRVVVTPLPPRPQGAGRLLVSFVEREIIAGGDAEQSVPSTEDQLQAELVSAREELRHALEQMEVANEDLKASNEEIRSINEELQASNEELETSKEELQSLNEELNTVNSQLETKVAELEKQTDDLHNLLNSTDIAILFLDRHLRVRWFTPAMKALLELRATDIGRPISHFAQHFGGGRLADEAQAVMERRQASKAEVADEEGRWYIRHITPYRTASDQVEGAVVTFARITERKRSEEELRASEERLRKVLDAGAVGVIFFGPDGTLVDCNEVFLQMMGYTREEVRSGSLSWRAMTPPEWVAASEEQLAKLARTGRIGPYEKEYLRKDGSRTWMLFAGADLEDGTLVEYCIDVSDRKRAEAERELLASELSHRVKNILAVVQALAARANEHTRSVKDFRESFIGRVQALARAHDLLLDSGWQTADLRQVIEQALVPFTDNGESLEMEGESIALGPRHGVALSLILYELATNAAKHGALSGDHGRVRVTWQPEDLDGSRKLRLRWQESGGPLVEEPRHKGFGVQLIERACAYELEGETELTFAPGGLVCELLFPIQEGRRSWEAAPVAGNPPSDRAGR